MFKNTLSSMKRINPNTGTIFVSGDTRDEDNRIFSSYNKRKVRKSGPHKGTFQELWLNPESHKKQKSTYYEKSFNPTKEGKERINPLTNKPYKRGDVREDGYIFIEYNRSRVTVDGYYKCRFSSPESKLRKDIRTNLRRKVREGLETNLTTDYLLSIFPKDSLCPVFKTKMEFGGDKRTSPSMDRIIPSKGYTKGNIVWISDRANSIKNDASYQEILKVGNWLKSLTKK